MSTTVNKGWLKDNNGEKFAPKTLSSQVLTVDGTSIDTTLEFLDGVNSNIQTQLDNKLSATNPTATGSFSLGRASNSEIGDNSVAMGSNNIASGVGATAIGKETEATGKYSYAEGEGACAEGYCSHAEGLYTIAEKSYSHSEGNNTVASGSASHSEGYKTTALGNYSHSEGHSLDVADFAYTTSTNNDTVISDWETSKFSLAKGKGSHVEGCNCLALSDYSHAEGYHTIATGDSAHSEGCETTAKNGSHSEGILTAALGAYSHAEGCGVQTIGANSHAEGFYTIASGDYSHAEGCETRANAYQHVQGHYNKTDYSGVKSGTGSANSSAFIIGNGTDSTPSNAFRVTYSGVPYALANFSSTGADYAEYFEWQDANPDAEDRRGYFVTLDEDKIKIAEPNDYVLGIISGLPSVIGNGDEDWMGKYLHDEFGSFIPEEFEYEETAYEIVPEEDIDEETGEVINTQKTVIKTVTKTGIRYKNNPDYDPSLQYISRSDRPEWDAVGILGVLSVRDDGSCMVNGYCKVAEGGIATASESGYRVIKRENDHIVKVIFK